ncbi:MAG TPA: hypothetical protein VMR65_01875 [Candidatus Sulfotelmatobacter sp.]|jgi:hypothetical protein|nr:hypothetical protein [Candidatus Sulfotelmatobacter sp.]
MKALTSAAVVVALTLVPSFPARAELFSKAYEFKKNTVLQVGTMLEHGLRLDSIEFIVAGDDGSPSGLFDTPKVKIAISNIGEKSVKVAISLAVTDEANRLVGVASGGTKLFPLRADRQMTYSLDFDGANSQLATGTAFRITIEAK